MVFMHDEAICRRLLTACAYCKDCLTRSRMSETTAAICGCRRGRVCSYHSAGII